ncbi:MAG: TIGR01777 family protein [Candidatus Anammoximicrobium sp.]|nr:TIGR01777 family protein [Candidatus Anammoximicrobium sp.]
MRALVTGATGFVGRKLLSRLQRPVVLSRDAAAGVRLGNEVQVVAWDPQREPAPAEAFTDVDVVFHLAGEPVAGGRWTAARKARIRDSRVVGTRNLADTIRRLARKPQVLVSASAIGYYGDRGDEVLDETAPPGGDFLSEVCVAWEREAQAVAEAGVRVVNVRLGVVLGRDGGALPRMLTPFRLGLGSPLGSGRQWMSWIHVQDVVGLMLLAAARGDLQGPLNAAAPQPATNREFTKALGRAVRRPTFLPAVPAGVLQLALGEMAVVLLASQRVTPRRAQAAGYTFEHPDLEEALRDVLR